MLFLCEALASIFSVTVIPAKVFLLAGLDSRYSR
jgi:hypothetical protein